MMILTACATIMFSMSIWTLNHEFRPDLNAVQGAMLKLNRRFSLCETASVTDSLEHH